MKTKRGDAKSKGSTLQILWNSEKKTLPAMGNPLVWQKGLLMSSQAQGYAFDSLNWRYWKKLGAQDFEDSIGWASVLHALGRAKGMKVVSEVHGGIDLRSQELTNLLLFRALSDKPQLYWLTPSGEVETRAYQKFDLQNFNRLIERFERGPFGAPIANLIYFDPQDQPKLAEAGWILPPIVTSLTAAGYDVRVTLNGEILNEAKLYYFVTPGGKVNPPSAWLKILENKDSLILFQSWRGISLQEPWRQIRKNLGISQTHVIHPGGRLPESSLYEGQTFASSGFSPSFQESCDLAQKDLEGRAYIGQSPVLLAGRGNHYFVNAKVLHLEFSYVLNNLLKSKGHMVHPLPGLVAWGPPTAIFALRDLETQVDLPGTGKKVRVFRRHPENGLVIEAVNPYEGRLKIAMKRHEVLIAERF